MMQLLKFLSFLLTLASLTVYVPSTNALALAPKSASKAPASYTNDDIHITSAIDFAMKDDIPNALEAAKKAKDPIYVKSIIEILRLYNAPSAITPTKAAEFLSHYPWIPDEVFFPKIERSINHLTAPLEVRSWFAYKKPSSNRGKFFLMHADIKLKAIDINHGETRSKFRGLWRSTEFDMGAEEYIIGEYKSIFTVDDLLKKIDFLIWNQSFSPAQKLINLLPPNYQSALKIKLDVAKNPELARKYINANSSKSDDLIKYVYIKSLLTNKIDPSILNFLANVKPTGHCEKWWKLKNIAFREALNNKNFNTAYLLTQNHCMESGADFADAQWYGGWVALEFLKKPDRAIKHFLHMYEGTKLANSKSKAAYWLARSYSALKNPTKAKFWYQKSAHYSSTFYGQLALAEIKGASRYNYFDSYKEHTKKTSSQADKDKIRKITLLSYHLFKANYKFLAYNIIDYIPSLKLDRIDLEAAAFFFSKRNLRPLAVELGKSSANRAFILIKEAYPTDVKITNTALPKAIYLAVIRQESNFDTSAVSSAGARGLMQLMPSTASKLARTLNLPEDAYIYDPNANVRKGSTYLDQLYSRYNNIILTIAAYNAGPGNVRKWITLIGDPRQMNTLEKINWIESVPFAETRNYIKKVLENMVIYDSMLTPSHNARSIIKFLEL